MWYNLLGDEMKSLVIINGSPREKGVSAELSRQVKPYFNDCSVTEYSAYELNAAPCLACGYCEEHDGCANKDLDRFFCDIERADYIIFISPVYNDFYPAPLKAVTDRFQRYLNARFKRGVKLPLGSSKNVGAIIISGSNSRYAADYMAKALRSLFEALGCSLSARYYIPNTDLGMYTFNLVELERFIHQIKAAENDL